jgi:ketosteroid isomerase-like protein
MRKFSRAAVPAAVMWVLALCVAAAYASSGDPPSPIEATVTEVSTAKPPAAAAELRKIAQLREVWSEAINTLDVHRLLGLYAPGAVLFPSEAPVQLGVASIGSWLGRWSAHADVHYALQATIVRLDGNWALEEWTADVTVTPRGPGEMAISGDPLQFRQHGVRVYRKDSGGRWRIDRETWSPDHPAATRFVALASPACSPTLC